MVLPKLRGDLNVIPSSDPQHPGLFIRDQYRYSEAWLIVPPLLVQGLKFFDGTHTISDLQGEFVRLSGDPSTAKAADHLFEGLDNLCFLDNERFAQLRADRHRQFAESPLRHAVHAGGGYPGDVNELRQVFLGYMAGPNPPRRPGQIGIAAPHASPGGGRQSYGAAYRTLTPDLRDRTFVILGTSHWGQPNRFGLTRKPFVTPYGTTRTNPALLDELASQPAVIMEDYCQAIEHSIEFQVAFLQHIYGPEVRILPILCGPFFPSIYNGTKPEDYDDHVKRFFGTLGEISAREGNNLFWVLGVDMAHIGERYGDKFSAQADQDVMLHVRERDFDRMNSLNAGDADIFWAKIQQNNDDLRWCGSSPFYTFLRTHPQARGNTEYYQHWQIDPSSVVSMAGISFYQ